MLGKSRSLDAKNRQAVEEIGAETALLRPSGKRLMRRRRHRARRHARSRFRRPSAIRRSPENAAAWTEAPEASHRSRPETACRRSPPQSRPVRRCTAPVKAPRAWPKSSASSNDSGMAAQFSATKGRSARGLSRWRARATTSFPVPVGPWIRYCCPSAAPPDRMRRLTSSIRSESPISSGTRTARMISSGSCSTQACSRTVSQRDHRLRRDAVISYLYRWRMRRHRLRSATPEAAPRDADFSPRRSGPQAPRPAQSGPSLDDWSGLPLAKSSRCRSGSAPSKQGGLRMRVAPSAAGRPHPRLLRELPSAAL